MRGLLAIVQLYVVLRFVYACRRRAGGRCGGADAGGAPVRERARGRRLRDVEGAHGRAARRAAGRRRDGAAQQAGRARQSALRCARLCATRTHCSALLPHLHLRLSSLLLLSFCSVVGASVRKSVSMRLVHLCPCPAAPLVQLCRRRPSCLHTPLGYFLVSRASLT